MRTLVVIIVLALAVPCVGLGQVAQQGTPLTRSSNPLVGTWELNVPKSTFTPGPPYKSETRTYEVSGEGHKFILKRVDAEGKPVQFQWTVNYDGKDYPWTGLMQADTISMTRIDVFTSESTMKKAGKVVNRTRHVVSQDTKVLTTYDEGTDANGIGYKNVMVFDKR